MSNEIESKNGDKIDKNEKNKNDEKKENNETNSEENTDKEGGEGLKKSLTLLDLIFFGLGNVTGAGIFVILSKTIFYGGKYTLPIFLIVTLISIIMGYCYLEIYSRYKSGITEYLAIKDTFGDSYGGIIIYMIYFFTIFSAITITISLSKYISNNIYFTNFYENTNFNQILMNIFLLIIMSCINYMGIESSKLFANTIAIALLVFLFGIIFSSLRFFDLKKIQAGPSVPWNSAVLSTIIAFFLFNGYDSIIKMSGEAINPKDAETALISTLGLTSVIYILIIISCICVLGFNVTTNSYFPLTEVYDKLYNPTIGLISYIFGFIIMFNTGFLSLLTATRFMYGCGKSNSVSFSDFWSQLNDNKAPTNAITVSLIFSILFACINNEVILSVFSNTSLFIILISICISVIVIRWKERNDPQKQKDHNYIWGNINNVPILVILELIILIILFGYILKNKFYLDKT